jgi:putative transposase
MRTKRRKKLTRPRVLLAVPSAVSRRWSVDFVSDQNDQFGQLRLNLTPKTAGQPEGMAFNLHSMEPADIMLHKHIVETRTDTSPNLIDSHFET